MKLNEILLPPGTKSRDLSPRQEQKIDMLQQRMSKYADKIGDPATSRSAKDFLKAKLKADLEELKSVIEHVNENAVPDAPKQYEVYDRKTGQRVGRPYSTASRARNVMDKKDNEYGGYRYGVRPVGQVNEAITKLPLTTKDFDLVKELMSRPIPAAIAPIYVEQILEDDEFTAELATLEDTEPGRDVRPLIVEWFKRVMPDQMYRFTDNLPTQRQKLGELSPIHGYDDNQHRGSNSPIVGNNYGSF